MKHKNHKILLSCLFFLVLSLIIPVVYSSNNSEDQKNISETTKEIEKEDIKIILNKTEGYKSLIEKLGIEIEEEIETRMAFSKKEGEKEIKSFTKSNKNLLNILEKREFKDYIKENDEQIPIIIILSKQNLNKVSNEIKEDFKKKMDPKLKEIEEIESKVKLSMIATNDPDSEEILKYVPYTCQLLF